MWELEQQLEDWLGRCPVCFMQGLPNTKHSFKTCKAAGAEVVWQDWDQMKTKMKKDRLFAPYSCCFDCHVPQAICQKWMLENDRWKYVQTNRCQFEDIIMPVVITAVIEGCCPDRIYQMMKNSLPEPGLYMLRYHSFYAWHREGA